MAVKVIMPQGGQDIELGRVVRWLKSEGDPVSEGEIICEVETEKAIFEVEAPDDGQLLKIVASEGQEIPIFAVIGYIGAPGESVPSDAQSVPHAVDGPPSSEQERVKKTMSSAQEYSAPISPRARRLADEMGVPLDKVSGTGPGSRVVEKDVRSYLATGSIDGSAGTIGEISNGHVVPMSKIRIVTARRMQQSNQTIPHFYVSLDVDMTKALQFKAESNEKSRQNKMEPVTITDMIVRATVFGFRVSPELNCSVKDAEHLILWDDLNVGIAVAVGDDLLVPVIPAVDRLTLDEIAFERARLVAKAQQGKLSSLANSRFTISNLGMFNIGQFIAVINPPETAILAVSSIQKKPAAMEDGQIEVRDICSLSLSVDHRAADGVIASRFINAVRSALEDPEQLED